jgi:hypothetical protein
MDWEATTKISAATNLLQEDQGLLHRSVNASSVRNSLR